MQERKDLPMNKLQKHSPQQTETESILTQVPDGQMRRLVDSLLETIPPQTSSTVLAQQKLRQSPSGLVQGIMDEYGVGRDQAEEWANMM